MNGLLVGDDARVAEWAFKTYNLRPIHCHCTIGIVDQYSGVLVGAVLFHFYNGCDAHFSYCGRGTLSPGIIRALARVCTGALDLSRVTMVISKKNRALARAMQRLGFVLEGNMRCYYGRRDCSRNTGIRLVMFRDRIDRIANGIVSSGN